MVEVGYLPGIVAFKIWNRTNEDIKGLTVSFLDNFKDRKVVVGKIKPNSSKLLGISVLFMPGDNNLILEKDGYEKAVIKEKVNSDFMGKIIINITGFTEDGKILYTSEFEK